MVTASSLSSENSQFYSRNSLKSAIKNFIGELSQVYIPSLPEKFLTVDENVNFFETIFH